MKIFEVISDTNIGGAGILLITRLKHTDRGRFDTTVLLPRNSALKARLEAMTVPVIEIDGCVDRSWDPHAIWNYVSVFQKHRPDLINCHGCLSARIAAKICGGSRVIYTRHCAYPPKAWQTSTWGRLLIGKVQHLLCDQIIAVADAAKDNLVDVGVSPQRVEVIINGVDGLRKTDWEERKLLRQQIGFDEDSIIVGICARLEPCKGHMDFLRAAELLLERSKHYRFLVVGDGSLKEELEVYCKSKRISSFVYFTGFQEDVAPYVNLFDIQVNCSVGTETSSLALSEGMSLGIPSVVSDYGGNPHMIKEGINGLIYPAHDYKKLFRQIHLLSSDPILYHTLSVGAYLRFCTEFHASYMTKQTEQLYLKCYSETKKVIRSISKESY